MACGHDRKGRFVKQILWLSGLAGTYLLRPCLLTEVGNHSPSKQVPSDMTQRRRVPTSGLQPAGVWPPQYLKQLALTNKPVMYCMAMAPLVQALYAHICHKYLSVDGQDQQPHRPGYLLSFHGKSFAIAFGTVFWSRNSTRVRIRRSLRVSASACFCCAPRTASCCEVGRCARLARSLALRCDSWLARRSWRLATRGASSREEDAGADVFVAFCGMEGGSWMEGLIVSRAGRVESRGWEVEAAVRQETIFPEARWTESCCPPGGAVPEAEKS